VTAESAGALDAEAAGSWGLNPFALVEAAGRTCAEVLVRSFPACFDRRGGTVPALTVLAGSGNNAADALVMLRALTLRGFADPAATLVLITRLPAAGEQTPLSCALRSIQKLDIPLRVWKTEDAASGPGRADIIIDGVTGTGLRGALRGAALEMAEAVNAFRETGGHRPFVVSVDVPSGGFDFWQPGMTVLTADATLAVEPRKRCLYTPALRPRAGTILPVGGIFPPALAGKYRNAELLRWQSAKGRVPPVTGDAYKYSRGVVEIRAGSAGAVGAAKLAARGAQAAGAGLVRLIVDDALYPLLAPAAGGVMVVPDSAAGAGRFEPDAVLLGPGWGKGPDRARLLETCLPLEERGLPLVLDADALPLAKDLTFHGNVILTPHAGEFAAYTGLPKAELLADPAPALRRCAAEQNVHILFTSPVLYAAAPDGRLGIIDGMSPVLAAGGSGDVLAGLCAAIAARQAAGGGFDGYACACAAAALLIEAACAVAGRFIDPEELAVAAASIAGKAWLPPAAVEGAYKEYAGE
jgi:NAD(P)H-hydrate epimerase